MYVCDRENKKGGVGGGGTWVRGFKLFLICLLCENLLVQVYDIFCDIILCVIIFIGSRYIFRPCIKIFCFFYYPFFFFFFFFFFCFKLLIT
jgi:hypothetical protein